MDVSAPDEALLLDLLNSTPVVDGVAHDLLAGQSAGDWLRRRGGSGSNAEREQATRAREVLQNVIRGRAAVTALAPLLIGVRSVPVVDGEGLAWTIEAPTARRLAVRAVLTWDELQQTHPNRLRPCANAECALFLIDHSKPNSARWCSMAVCGNRMKARRHYQRTRNLRP